MHILLGQVVIDEYSPLSNSVIIDYITKLAAASKQLGGEAYQGRAVFHGMTAEKVKYVENELRFISRERFDSNVNVERLEKVPRGLVFPEVVKAKVSYDSKNGLLIFRGVMTDQEYDGLMAVSDDSSYRHAVNNLRQLSAETLGIKGPWRRFLRDTYKKYIKREGL